jgi:hypothetical protein
VTLCIGNQAHGIVEGQAEDLDAGVNGVAGEVVTNFLVKILLPVSGKRL